ncbi:MAG: BamA/TamA family outer membrane protein [Acidobacteriia bacterium]|nr:BamA/TamA family outer membrane protein [Terriglobia bacterium]
MRLRGALLRALTALAVTAAMGVPPAAHSSVSPAQDQSPSQSPPALGTISSYLGLTVQDIRFEGVSPRDSQQLQRLIPEKAGEPLDRGRIRESIQTLHATGRFSDIWVEAERTGDSQVLLTFVTSPNFFVGQIRVQGQPNRPNANQVVNASKLSLGELFTEDKLKHALDNIKQLMEGNGYYRSTVAVQQVKHPETQEIDVTFQITPGPQARIGQVKVIGNPGYSAGQIQDIARMHSADLISAQRVSAALDRLRKKYQKQNRLLAQVSIPERSYHPESNSVDYAFDIQPGPKVDIVTEGFKISKGVLKKNVPVYEENALDDDLLNEGRRNLLNYLQSRGYFDAKVGVKKHEDTEHNELRVFYTMDAGPRHKLVKIDIRGNQYFPEDLLRSHMQVQPFGRLFENGRYSQGLLNGDVRNLENLYVTNGFQQAKITSNVTDNYAGQQNRLAIEITVNEGPQTLVGALHIVGNQAIPGSRFPALNTDAGQPYSESNIASDREILLNYYFNHGFPDAIFEASAKPAGEPNRMDVTFTIHEGQQVFIDQVLVSGLEHTRPGVVQRQLQVKSGEPLSQIDLLKTQQKLYDLGIFSQVETAVQNLDGEEREKNVLVDVQEAKRYTFLYGLGLEFQTGTPAVGTSQPLGETGLSPRVSFEVTRLNFRGLNHTVTFKTHVGRLQQRALVSYNAPGLFNSENWRLSFTSFYDNTLDVTTFTSRRLEGSVQAEQTISKASTMDYRFAYRQVKASNIEISPDQIPLLSRPTRVGGPGFSYIRNKRDNDLETTKGNYTTLDGSVASGYFGSEADFSRILIQNSTYHAFGKNRPAGKKFVFARSTRIGIETQFGSTFVLAPGQPCPHGQTTCTVIPLPERFFSGGGNSHRGFGLNQAGPRDPVTGFPLGGAALFLNNLELRLPPVTLPFFQDNISFAIFHDAGNVFTNGHDMLHSLLRWRQKDPEICQQAPPSSTVNQCNYNFISHAIGVGVRYKTPIGPVRFDFGYNLNPPRFPSTQTVTNPATGLQESVFVPQQVSHFNVFFSIGQTF